MTVEILLLLVPFASYITMHYQRFLFLHSCFPEVPFSYTADEQPDRFPLTLETCVWDVSADTEENTERIW